jgi:RecA/RadA recombinase
MATGKTGFVTTSEEGLRSLHILEVAGPPGSGKASIALELIHSAIEQGQRVVVAGRYYFSLGILA